MTQKFMTTQEVAERFRVTSQTIKQWVRTGGIKAKKVGGKGKLLFDEEYINKLTK